MDNNKELQDFSKLFNEIVEIKKELEYIKKKQDVFPQYNNNEPEDTETNLRTNFISMVIISIISIPFIIVDVYYALTDNSCVSKFYYHEYLTLKNYLYASCLFKALNLFIVYIYYCIHFAKNNNKLYKSEIIINKVFDVITTIIAIIGGIIFWNNNTTSCDNKLYYYLYISIILRYVLFGINIIHNLIRMK